MSDEKEILYFKMNMLQAEIRMNAMIAENKMRETRGEKTIYGEKAFTDLIDEYRYTTTRFRFRREQAMIEKYISASKLKAHYSWLGKDATLSPKDVDDIVDAQPAADVVPVVRGELRINDQGFLECSACGKTLRMPLVSTHEMKRCYICGAYVERSGSGE